MSNFQRRPYTSSPGIEHDSWREEVQWKEAKISMPAALIRYERCIPLILTTTFITDQQII